MIVIQYLIASSSSNLVLHQGHFEAIQCILITLLCFANFLWIIITECKQAFVFTHDIRQVFIQEDLWVSNPVNDDLSIDFLFL